MTKTALYDMKGKIVDQIELVLGPVSEPAVYESVKNYLNNQRQGTASSKNRGEVSGSGAKPWKQKGTGRARVGSKRTPVWKGGGAVFGPKPRDFKVKLSVNVKRRALLSALTDKALSEKMVVVDHLTLDVPKTSEMIKILENLGLDRPLVVIDEPDRKIALSLRNIKGCHLTQAANLNAYQVIEHSQLLITKRAMQKLQERLEDV